MGWFRRLGIFWTCPVLTEKANYARAYLKNTVIIMNAIYRCSLPCRGFHANRTGEFILDR